MRGFYWCWNWGKRSHWWLTTPEGEVVDPTVSQFPAPQIGDYEPWIEGTREPIGKCINCGEECFDNFNFCSDKCMAEMEAWANASLKPESVDDLPDDWR